MLAQIKAKNNLVDLFSLSLIIYLDDFGSSFFFQNMSQCYPIFDLQLSSKKTKT